MNDPNKPGDLTEGWPDEPGKAEIEAFARDLQVRLPELPPVAMQRVGGQMHDELAVQRWRKRRLRVVASTVLAASLLIGVGIWRVIESADNMKPNSPAALAVRNVPTVRDQYRVPVMATPVVPSPDSRTLLPADEQKRIASQPLPKSDRPLVALDSHRNLFTND